ncbi:VOC family protein [Cupriavidus basilensis]|uniref:VOC family protein n=1 Tax=Cupriavidus basilensis TaxID=68895 RepID=UPI00157AF222|nr:VOC family protein [Cupriavidus basilensis]NUA31690.1 VOC family protein [Cupriavidus basilensis]
MQSNLLLYPVDDIDATLPFFEQGLGMAVKFRDGGRYCALDAGPITIALVAGEERLVSHPALAFRLQSGEDIAAAIEHLLARGARIVQPLASGPHELRAVLTTPQGFPLVVSAKPARPAG